MESLEFLSSGRGVPLAPESINPRICSEDGSKETLTPQRNISRPKNFLNKEWYFQSNHPEIRAFQLYNCLAMKTST